MFKKFLIIISVCITTVLSGCATTGGADNHGITEEVLCLMAMSMAGAGASAAIENEPEVFIPGAIIGGAIGYLVCGDENQDTPSRPADSDGDGVTDNNDQCPGTPRGTRVNASGCALDSDRDGVADNNDRCPGTPRGAAVNSSGCELDSDNDGVVNRIDQCPSTPRGQAVNNVGCHMIFTLEGVNFEYNSAQLTNAAQTKLNEAVNILNDNRNINVNIEGHTDSNGADAYNMQLSERRAKAVVDHLAENGINRSRMTAVGKGESSPISSNDTSSGRAQNRRVEFIIRN